VAIRTILDRLVVSASILGSVVGCTPEQGPTATQPGGHTDAFQPTVYYGLNESHSRDWAQVNSEGTVGITYFQRISGSSDAGTLYYKTIGADGSEKVESVTTGSRLEISVLLYDASSEPHVFVASSDDSDQTIDHYERDDSGQWRMETIVHFFGEGGKAIYELSADTGPDSSFHLLILKTRSIVDSPDFNDAWKDSKLYHLSNASGAWEKELIRSYDMAYNHDWHIKSSSRQDIAVDKLGHVHVVFVEQCDGVLDPSRLLYATNATGVWVIETAVDYHAGTRDQAGLFPSLALDGNGVPHVSYAYVARVTTGSATRSTLYLLRRLGPGSWQSETVAERDDGYYGGDGRAHTGGLSHLVIDSQDKPRIVFSDLASTHWYGLQGVNVGNIRYGVFEDGTWHINTVYRQPLPTGFHTATEMHGLCLLVSENTNTIHVVGQELVIQSEGEYSSSLLEFSWHEDIS
jgi:hypothetical protein